MILADVDTSLLLVTGAQIQPEEPLWTRMTTFLEPFDNVVWVTMLAITISAGVVNAALALYEPGHKHILCW